MITMFTLNTVINKQTNKQVKHDNDNRNIKIITKVALTQMD